MRWQDKITIIVASMVTIFSLNYAGLSIADEVPSVPEEILDSPKVFQYPGSYRLEGNIIAAHPGNAIEIMAPDVTLDMNGYSISSLSSSSVGISSFMENVTVMNGSVRGFSQAGIDLQGRNCRIQNVRVTNSGIGVSAFENCLVQDNTLTDNTGPGLVFPPALPSPPDLFGPGMPVFANNIINNNNGGNQSPQVEGAGLEIGTNVCGNKTLCSNATLIVSPAAQEVEVLP
ncbi:MAG: hypothetical protein WAN46_22025 [Gammaproteobacteria bacterium]|jgi:hypothetical protein